MEDKKERYGLIIGGELRTAQATLVEYDDARTTRSFSTANVAGNLSGQDRSYPARLGGAVVAFVLDDADEVVVIRKLGYDMDELRKMTVCDSCKYQAYAGLGVCQCGNEMYGGQEHCAVCAVRKRQCTGCGASI